MRYFERLANRVDELKLSMCLADAAHDALKEMSPSDEVAIEDLLTWISSGAALPEQHDLPSHLGNGVSHILCRKSLRHIEVARVGGVAARLSKSGAVATGRRKVGRACIGHRAQRKAHGVRRKLAARRVIGIGPRDSNDKRMNPGRTIVGLLQQTDDVVRMLPIVVALVAIGEAGTVGQLTTTYAAVGNDEENSFAADWP